MSTQITNSLIECVPNFSEGRDPANLAAIRTAIASVPDILMLKSEMDSDHHRSVITFAGPPAAVCESAFRGIEAALQRIDLRRHSGVHPRIGAADVVPLVPVQNISLKECAVLARSLGQRVWTELSIPVYFYEAAALSPERTRLEKVRRGGFENPALLPDIGGPALHPTAGAVIIGARKFLIAFNINLNTPDVAIAKTIARRIRASSGGLPYVKALGLRLESRNLAQVSMNLTDFEQTPLHLVYELVRDEAATFGVTIAESEIIGLIPAKALEMAAAHFLRVPEFQTVESRISQVRSDGGLAGL